MCVVGFILQLVQLPFSTAASIEIDHDQVKGKQLLESTYPASIRIDDAMSYLNELQQLATAENGTRAIDTTGFNRTLDYLTDHLAANTNFRITKKFFSVRKFTLAHHPTLLSSINGQIVNHSYSTDPSKSDFLPVRFSTTVNLSNYTRLTVIPNFGCSHKDWLSANPPTSGRIVLINLGLCPFREKGDLAAKYNATGILFYNDGTSPDNMAPISVSLAQTNSIPALFLSFTLGERLAQAARDLSSNVAIRFSIVLTNEAPIPVGNICADTPTGDPTQTILIGSHSDSVPAGPGINDNGDGSAANLALAATLARLFRTRNYAKYKYRIRFCWWGAEEVGLLGSAFHVSEALKSTVVGERIIDYLFTLNLDMLASPNFMFGIYDGHTARNDTPPMAMPGSNKVAILFQDWFIRQGLPWDYTEYTDRADYAPFLAAGVATGDLFSGADDIKTQEQRDRYDRILGQGQGGMAGVPHDPCYHKACDSIQNVNVFVYEKMIKAAAYAIESLARQADLKTWLYPIEDSQRVTN
ncbi:unnamed protein product [Rotaria sp. Silwood2]|nr:unnamed protein product [Rotaria sp. Silwood2]CAF3028376.1 unnamed protein product [Rotaria sp. Silwood2]CAF3389194.1 unnamed protein product [Rotaria sp. Silwood2]CAF4016407.1 unnamed protein product [Rotaria sp. Silwood2]CAF4283279.1 unnamed protein product [Rotaria sp. Silwood2]